MNQNVDLFEDSRRNVEYMRAHTKHDAWCFTIPKPVELAKCM